MSKFPKTIEQANKLIKKQALSYSELNQHFLNTIEKKDKGIAAFLTVNKDISKEAKELDKLAKKEEKLPPLAGMTFAVKDNILMKGYLATAGSKILKEYKAAYNAAAIKKLKQQKSLCIGKTNLDEFGMGSSTENSAFQITKNPIDLSRAPGGSSGGSAAAVAADECLFALGTDTGGSIRQPAAFCGVVGLKPTYGRVSRHGLIALASSLDVIGSITKTTKDAAKVFYAIAGQDNYDATSCRGEDKPEKLFQDNPKKLTIGVPEEYFPEELDDKIKQVINERIDQISEDGFQVKKIKLPHTPYGLAAYYIIMPSEASANLARYDTLRYGKRIKDKFEDIIDFYIKTRTKKFGDEVRRRIMLGVYSLSAGYYDDYYIKAQKTRKILKEEFEKAFQDVDVLITPTTPTPAFKLGAKATPLDMYFSDIFTVPASLAGLPALSLPCGKKGKLPIGMQLIGKRLHEDDLFKLANYFEENLF